MDNIEIREASAKDFNDIIEVEKKAFGHDKEAGLVSDLLGDSTAAPVLSLLAFNGQEAVGHILFTRAYIENADKSFLVYILAPLAVKPGFQKKGIGGMLIKEGVKILRERGAKLVFVLGHKEYYPKHGFKQNAQAMGYPPPFPNPVPKEYAEYWMVQHFTDENMPKGRVLCADTLHKPEHWRE